LVITSPIIEPDGTVRMAAAVLAWFLASLNHGTHHGGANRQRVDGTIASIGSSPTHRTMLAPVPTITINVTNKTMNTISSVFIQSPKPTQAVPQCP
jgi:hypothetical protein